MTVFTVYIMSIFASTSEIEAKMKKVYLGKFYISSYDMSDNTPSNSYATASGKKATVGRTVAVDRSNPIVPMGSKVVIQGLGERIVEDTGGFGRYNGGMRKFDVFTEVGHGFLKQLKTWLVRPETKAEKKKRIKRVKMRQKRRRERRARKRMLARKKRQKGTFLLQYEPILADWQMISDPEYIKSGTVRIGTKYFDIKDTREGIGNVLLVGDEELKDLGLEIQTKLDEVCEEAVG
jgi:3D (Asp-Asp-Asp) domain-containing protein